MAREGAFAWSFDAGIRKFLSKKSQLRALLMGRSARVPLITESPPGSLEEGQPHLGSWQEWSMTVRGKNKVADEFGEERINAVPPSQGRRSG